MKNCDMESYTSLMMDPDGFQIGALVVNILFTYWPELFEDKANPFVNIFMTPYIIARKGKENKYWYGDDYASFDPEKNKGWEITRAKGLSSLRPVDWKYSLQNPNLLPIVNDPDMAETLDLIFNGARADDRKNWMAE